MHKKLSNTEVQIKVINRISAIKSSFLQLVQTNAIAASTQVCNFQYCDRQSLIMVIRQWKYHQMRCIKPSRATSLDQGASSRQSHECTQRIIVSYYCLELNGNESATTIQYQ